MIACDCYDRWASIPYVSPIEWAVLLGDEAVTRLLLARGAKVDRPLSALVCTQHDLSPGSTVVHLCAKLGGRRRALLEALLAARPLARKLTDVNGRTPLHVADPRLASLLEAR